MNVSNVYNSNTISIVNFLYMILFKLINCDFICIYNKTCTKTKT